MQATSKKMIKSIAFIAASLSLLLTGCMSEPSEDDVRLLFRAKKPILERIVEMSNEDYAKTSVTRIDPDFTRLENNWGWPRPEHEIGFSAERWDEYRALFDDAELPQGLDRAGESNEGVMFSVWGFGIADNSSSKGFVFLPKQPSNVESENQRIVYKPLGDGWYYFEWVTW